MLAGTVVLGMAGVLAYTAGRPTPLLLVAAPQASLAAPTGTVRPSAASARGLGGQMRRVSVSAGWVADTARTAGIPEPAVRAYGAATLREQGAEPRCHLAWTTLAGIGWVESQHGTLGGLRLDRDGRPSRRIDGPVLDGSGDVAAVPDGSGAWQRATGPLQFIGSTWRRWASDGDGDGITDPQDIDDAAYTAARYLCASGADLATGPGWSSAVFSYNHSGPYVRAVHDAAQTYADRASG